MSELMAIAGSGVVGVPRWLCVTCGVRLQTRREVRQHWMQHNIGHSLYRKITTGHIYHQTIEGLHSRPSASPTAETPDQRDDADMATSWVFEVGERVVLSQPCGQRAVQGQVVARGVLEGKRTYLVLTSHLRPPLRLLAEELLAPADSSDRH